MGLYLSGGAAAGGTTAIANGGTGATNGQLAIAGLQGYTSTVTSASPVTLTASSTYMQAFTGSTAQTVVMPVTSTLQQGFCFLLVNLSTVAMTINSSGANNIITLPVGACLWIMCIDTTVTTAAGWRAGLTGWTANSGTGSVVMSSNPSITSIVCTGTMNWAGAATNTHVLGTALTTGTLTLGATTQTGLTILGQSTLAHTTNIDSGATASGSTKTLSIGTGGLSGSTTAITIGAAAGTASVALQGTVTSSGSVAIGGGSFIAKTITTTTTWDPASLADGASETKSSITMTGVAVGDVVTAALTTIIASTWRVQACVTATDTVAVTITNNTGGTVDLASGTLRINCIKF